MEQVTDGLAGPMAEFRKVGAWPASMGLGGASGAFNTAVYNPAHHSNPGLSARQMAEKRMDTSSLPYVSMV